ncbi:MAG TPA: MFS transporter [Acidimicrobiales bacterium]
MNKAATTDLRGQRGWRRQRCVVAVSLAIAMVGLNTTAIGVATRGIADDLGVSLTTLSWIVGAYLLTAASFSLIGGRLGDVLGRSHTFVLGVVVFASGSVVAALAPSSAVLIVGRVIEGLGAALVMPTSVEMLAAYPPAGGARQGFRARGVVYAASFGIGPLVGGLLTDHLSWRAIFWFETAVLVVAGLLAFPLLRIASHVPKTPTRDLRGAVLSALIVLVAVGGVFRVRVWGWISWPAAACLAGSVALVALLGWVEARTPDPILHRGLLRNRIVVGANVATVAASIGMIGLVYFFNLFAQSAAMFSSNGLAIAAALVPFAASMLLFAVLADALSRRFGYRGPVLAGLGLAVGGFAWLSTTSGATTKLDLLVPLTLCGIGAGIANAGLTGPAVLSESRQRLDEAAGLLSLSRFVGAALAVAIGTSTYLSVAVRLPAADTLTGDTEQVAMGGSAFQAVVATLGHDLRAPFEAAARSQTAAAFAATMRLAAVVVAALTVLSAWLLRPDRTRRSPG